MNDQTLAPVSGGERIISLDILRGLALFGILVVNMKFFAYPIFFVVTEPEVVTNWYNEAAGFLIRMFFEGKFITLFSFLFGLGFFIFTERLREKDIPVRRVFLRRMFILFIIGLAHGFFFWAGDILAIYALCGIIMLAFMNRKSRTIRIWIGIFMTVIILIMAGLHIMIRLGSSVPEIAESLNEEIAETRAGYNDSYERGMIVYRGSDVGAMIEYRREELALVWTGLVFRPNGFLYILIIFLTGLLVGRSGFFLREDLHNSRFVRRLPLWLGIGMAASLLQAYASPRSDSIMFDGWMMAEAVGILVGAPMLCMAYVALVLRLLGYDKWKRRLGMLAPVGRMALTNYLLQTLICTTLFLGYGFGLFGKISSPAGLLIAILIFAFQLVFSNWYMNRFRMGPLEKLWRMGTYLKKV